MGRDGPKRRDLEGVGLIISRHHENPKILSKNIKKKEGKSKIINLICIHYETIPCFYSCLPMGQLIKLLIF